MDALLQDTGRLGHAGQAHRAHREGKGVDLGSCTGWWRAGSCRADRQGSVQVGMMGWAWLDMQGLEVKERQDWAAETEVLDSATCLSLPTDLLPRETLTH